MVRYKIIHPDDFSDEQTEAIIATLPEWRREEAMRYKHKQKGVCPFLLAPLADAGLSA